ncbi:hypothetical protein [Micromonospora chalcea]|uniref:vWA-MoxR associated conflict system protein n=1 Tax=Micromonospora chalcea TaxID=1874 RepID=UPI003CEBE0F5
MSIRRHLLVVATQCHTMGPPLARLEEAAQALHVTLTDDRLGACVPGLPRESGLLVGYLDQAEIERNVRTAVEYAAEHSATLVLALLGHGFVPGENPTLYLMAQDSVQGLPNTAVNVPALLQAAVDRMGVAGVLALIDTCSAAGAVPPAPSLITGAREGRSRLDLLMASAVQQSAIDFDMTTALVDLIRAGAGDTPTLSVEAILPELRARARRQSIVFHRYDGHAEDLWLTRNPRIVAVSSRYGSYGFAQYQRVMSAALPDLAALPPVPEALDLLLAAPESPLRMRAESVVRDLYIVLRTCELLRGALLRDAVTHGALRRASPVGLPPEFFAPGALTEAEVTGYLMLNPPVGQSGAAQLVRFVFTLAEQAGRDLHAPELRRWVDELGLMVYANEVIAQISGRRAPQELRLIVSLHASLTGDWPEVIQAWVMHGDEDVDQADHPCEPSPDGVAGAVFAAVDQAERFAETRGLPLRHVEVAAPAGLLLQWRPEEIELGIRLGQTHSVMLHWSERFKQSPEIRRINRWLRDRLRSERPTWDRPFDWLDDHRMLEIGTLREQLKQRTFGIAVAVGCRPREPEEVLTLLLTFTPIVIWPGEAILAGDPRADLVAAWRELPEGFLTAYRKRWRNEPAQNVLADLRAVWDDERWLEFCRRMQWRTTQEERS